MMATISLISGNLFQAAFNQYGDPTQWIVLAQANGLTDPFILTPTTLTVPPTPPPSTGGIPSQ